MDIELISSFIDNFTMGYIFRVKQGFNNLETGIIKKELYLELVKLSMYECLNYFRACVIPTETIEESNFFLEASNKNEFKVEIDVLKNVRQAIFVDIYLYDISNNLLGKFSRLIYWQA